MGFIPTLWWLGQWAAPVSPSLFPAELAFDQSVDQALEGWLNRQVPTGPNVLESTPDSYPPEENRDSREAPPLGGSPDYIANRQYAEDLRQYTRDRIRDSVRNRAMEEYVRNRRSVE